MNNETEKKRAKKILDILKEEYPDAKIALNFSNPFQLLVATILSAQCTDQRVNIVTKDLFKKYKAPKDFLDVSNDELEKDIFSTGFYKQKAKSIKACCKELVEKYNGKVPADFNELVKLPGVGRKTASVVAGNAFGIPAIAVDTHVKRLSNLLGFVDTENADKIEERLKELFPKEYWVLSSHLLATHGRKICVARKPKCEQCVIAKYCPSNKLISGKN
uniref:Endonuclease III n=3 Tax=Ignavibacterium album TaxID=591197 RepID=A0A7V3E754_9BACT